MSSVLKQLECQNIFLLFDIILVQILKTKLSTLIIILLFFLKCSWFHHSLKLLFDLCTSWLILQTSLTTTTSLLAFVLASELSMSLFKVDTRFTVPYISKFIIVLVHLAWSCNWFVSDWVLLFIAGQYLALEQIGYATFFVLTLVPVYKVACLVSTSI